MKRKNSKISKYLDNDGVGSDYVDANDDENHVSWLQEHEKENDLCKIATF
jgi:hypothetical protein